MHRRERNPKFKNIFFRNVFLEVCPKIPVYATGCLGLHFYIDAAPKLLMAVHLFLTSPGPGSTIYKYIESFNALVTVPVTLSLAGACMCHCAVLTLSASGGRPAGQVSRRPGNTVRYGQPWRLAVSRS